MEGSHLDDNLHDQPEQPLPAPTPIANADVGHYQTIATSYPDQILRHNISDEELDMLCEQRKEYTREMQWAAFGIAGGAFPGTLAGLGNYLFGEKAGTIALENLAHTVLFFVGAAVGTAAYFIQSRRGANATDLKDAIRARTKRHEQR